MLPVGMPFHFGMPQVNAPLSKTTVKTVWLGTVQALEVPCFIGHLRLLTSG
jgi:hypothetical protein